MQWKLLYLVSVSSCGVAACTSELLSLHSINERRRERACRRVAMDGIRKSVASAQILEIVFLFIRYSQRDFWKNLRRFDECAIVCFLEHWLTHLKRVLTSSRSANRVAGYTRGVWLDRLARVHFVQMLIHITIDGYLIDNLVRMPFVVWDFSLVSLVSVSQFVATISVKKTSHARREKSNEKPYGEHDCDDRKTCFRLNRCNVPLLSFNYHFSLLRFFVRCFVCMCLCVANAS